jgi:hypothetical protein
MDSFHVTLHARPREAIVGPRVVLRGVERSTLAVDQARLNATTFNCTFEQAIAALAALARMYCEPDGSFVWVSPQGASPWQIEGNLFDRAGRLLFVDLKGNCPGDQFDLLLPAFGWPATPVVFLLAHEAVFLDEAQFRQYASM